MRNVAAPLLLEANVITDTLRCEVPLSQTFSAHSMQGVAQSATRLSHPWAHGSTQCPVPHLVISFASIVLHRIRSERNTHRTPAHTAQLRNLIQGLRVEFMSSREGLVGPNPSAIPLPISRTSIACAELDTQVAGALSAQSFGEEWEQKSSMSLQTGKELMNLICEPQIVTYSSQS